MKDLIDILIAGGVSVTAPTVPVSNTPPASTPIQVPVKPKRASKPKKEALQKPKEAHMVETTKLHLPSERICTSVPSHIQFIESTDDPMEMEVIPIILKKLVHKGIEYWHDSNQGTVYTRTAEGMKGGYVGHWDAEICAFKT
jgi:hypothetical protein